MSDNFHFDLTGVAPALALQVAFSLHPRATHWFETPALPRPVNRPANWRGSGDFDWVTFKEKYPIAAHKEWPQPVAPRMVLCWTKPEGTHVKWHPAGHTGGSQRIRDNRPDLLETVIEAPIQALPGKGLDHEGIRPFIEAWLKDVDYGDQPDHDGDNGRGFRIYNEAWGHACGLWHGFAVIEPSWLLYGK